MIFGVKASQKDELMLQLSAFQWYKGFIFPIFFVVTCILKTYSAFYLKDNIKRLDSKGGGFKVREKCESLEIFCFSVI